MGVTVYRHLKLTYALLHIAVWYFVHSYMYVTLIVSDNTSSSEHQSTSQVLPESDHVTVHSTPAGKHPLVN